MSDAEVDASAREHYADIADDKPVKCWCGRDLPEDADKCRRCALEGVDGLLRDYFDMTEQNVVCGCFDGCVCGTEALFLEVQKYLDDKAAGLDSAKQKR